MYTVHICIEEIVLKKNWILLPDVYIYFYNVNWTMTIAFVVCPQLLMHHVVQQLKAISLSIKQSITPHLLCTSHQSSHDLSVDSLLQYLTETCSVSYLVFSLSRSVVSSFSFLPRRTFSHKDRTVGVCFQPENTVTHLNRIWELKAELNKETGRVYSLLYSLKWFCAGLHWSVQPWSLIVT